VRPRAEPARGTPGRERYGRAALVAGTAPSLRLLLALGALLVACRSGQEAMLPSSAELRQALDGLPPRVLAGPVPGRAWLDPDEMRAGEVGSWTVVVRVGRGGVGPGGGFLVDLPKPWLTLLDPLCKPVQTRDPAAPHYLGVESSRPESALSLAVERLGFDSKVDRFQHVVAIVVHGAPLRAGDEVRVRFATTTAPFLAGDDQVRVAVDRRGDDKHALIAHGAAYTVRSGPAEKLLFVAPSDAVVGQPARLRVTLFDRFFNPAAAAGVVEVGDLDGEPLTERLDGGEGGVLSLSWTPRAEGFRWPTVAFSPRGPGAVISMPGNPVRVHVAAPRERVYWGDIHSHSGISRDGIGGDSFAFAHDFSHLDFFASTEHADDDRPREIERNGITPREWNHVRHRVHELDAPGRFATLLAYECNLLDGHRCVYFRGEDGIPWPPAQLEHKAEKLWLRLDPRSALAIPHHLGRGTHVEIRRVLGPGLEDVLYADVHAARGEIVDWRHPQPDDLQPALEIYSSHGSSERYDPADALAYERVRYLPSHSFAGPHYAWDAWRLGHRVGVVGGSDNHTAQPGLPHNGLTASIVPELTREAVFDAIAARRTYATTGERILLDLRLGDRRMGEVLVAEGELAGSILVAAPREIRYAELVAVPEGDAEPSVLARWDDPGRLLERSFTVSAPTVPAAVYLRCELVGETEGRVARGWTSPVFVAPRGTGERTAVSVGAGGAAALAAGAP
jgi:hypothetical protein